MKLLKEFVAVFIALGILILILHAVLPADWLARLGFTQ
jgi:hypothetical protein